VDSQVAQIVQAMGAEGGFDIRIETLEASTMVAATQRGDYDAAIVIWSGRPDPDGNISMWLASDGFLNWGKYASPELDAALAAARRSTDTATRRAQYALAADRWMADRPHLILYHHRWFWALRAGVTGFQPSPDGIIRFGGLRPAR
jgi:peptide/nickel transport system substrate-binding protein